MTRRRLTGLVLLLVVTVRSIRFRGGVYLAHSPDHARTAGGMGQGAPPAEVARRPAGLVFHTATCLWNLLAFHEARMRAIGHRYWMFRAMHAENLRSANGLGRRHTQIDLRIL